ncbi:MAG: MazG family protein [Verrucomicrobia bacterium]|nr:MAG: MazG family protein [Verrucomicrobiota bacterium]
MKALQELKEIIAHLRGPEGCPWDQQQTHKSLCGHLIEECSELLETIDRGDIDHMREELGDLLLHIYLHAQIADDEGFFDIEDVAKDICEKLIRRHPHVFGEAKIADLDELYHQWEKIKGGEKKRGVAQKGVMKHLPPRLPALLFAKSVYNQIHKKGLNANGLIDADAVERLKENLDEEKVGRMLFEISAVCGVLKIDPESALRQYAGKIVEEVERRHEQK